MTLDDYFAAWEADAEMDLSDLDNESRRVPLLHAKWWKLYTAERLRYKKLDFEYKQLYKLRWEYWLGKLDEAERIKRGWPVQPMKVLQGAPLNVYLEGDPVLAEKGKSRVLSEETLRFLEDVIKSINNRGYLIRSALDYLKFKMGT